MVQSWQAVAYGLPAPVLPMPASAWRTRYFTATFVLNPSQAVTQVAQFEEFHAAGQILALPSPHGQVWHCRLAAEPEVVADERDDCRLRLEFEVMD